MKEIITNLETYPVTAVSAPYLNSDLKNLKNREGKREKRE